MTTSAKNNPANKIARASKATSTKTNVQNAASQEQQASVAEAAAQQPPTPHTVEEPTAGATKIGAVLALMQRDSGATLDELTHSTGWLPHTMRAAMTGLRKNGHVIDRTKVDGISRYRLAEVVA